MLLSTRAEAHTPVKGLGEFANGFLHPLLTLPHVLILGALGILLGQRQPLRLKDPALILIVFAAVGLTMTVTGAVTGVYPPILIIVSLCIGALVTFALPLPAWVVFGSLRCRGAGREPGFGRRARNLRCCGHQNPLGNVGEHGAFGVQRRVLRVVATETPLGANGASCSGFVDRGDYVTHAGILLPALEIGVLRRTRDIPQLRYRESENFVSFLHNRVEHPICIACRSIPASTCPFDFREDLAGHHDGNGLR